MIQPPKFETQDYAIGGKMVVGRAVMEDSFMQLLNGGDEEAKNNIRRSLIMQMAEYMLDNKLVEFTQQKAYDPKTFAEVHHILVRAYIAPNDQVKILRTVAKPL